MGSHAGAVSQATPGHARIQANGILWGAAELPGELTCRSLDGRTASRAGKLDTELGHVNGWKLSAGVTGGVARSWSDAGMAGFSRCTAAT